MPKSRTSIRSSSSSKRSSSSSKMSSSSSSSRKKTTTRKQPKGVPMPVEHIKRIVNGEKDLYVKVLHRNFEHEDAFVAMLSQLSFKKPNEPYSFWGKIYTWQDAVQKALPHSRPKM